MTTYTYANPEKTLIRCGQTFVPTDPLNMDYQRIVEENVEIGDFVPEVITTAEPTKAELLAQMQELMAKIEALP